MKGRSHRIGGGGGGSTWNGNRHLHSLGINFSIYIIIKVLSLQILLLTEGLLNKIIIKKLIM